MEVSLFRQYLEVAKELGVTRFKIEHGSMSADLIQVVRQIELDELTKDMPSDEALLGLDEPGPVNLGEK